MWISFASKQETLKAIKLFARIEISRLIILRLVYSFSVHLRCLFNKTVGNLNKTRERRFFDCGNHEFMMSVLSLHHVPWSHNHNINENSCSNKISLNILRFFTAPSKEVHKSSHDSLAQWLLYYSKIDANWHHNLIKLTIFWQNSTNSRESNNEITQKCLWIYIYIDIS